MPTVSFGLTEPSGSLEFEFYPNERGVPDFVRAIVIVALLAKVAGADGEPIGHIVAEADLGTQTRQTSVSASTGAHQDQNQFSIAFEAPAPVRPERNGHAKAWPQPQAHAVGIIHEPLLQSQSGPPYTA